MTPEKEARHPLETDRKSPPRKTIHKRAKRKEREGLDDDVRSYRFKKY